MSDPQWSLWCVAMSVASQLVYELKGLSDPAVSPDGQRVVYAMSWVEGTGGAAENRSRLMLVDADGTEREFTQGAADNGPRFSPDGSVLAFLRARQSGEPRQVWVIHAHGGEARQVTSAAKGVQDFAWSPDGSRIVYCADTEPAAGAAAGGQVEGPRVIEIDRIRYRHDLQGWRGDAHYHLFVVDIASGELSQITRGDWDDFGPVWSPDGTKIAFISGRRDDRDFRALTEAYVVNAEGGVAECWSGALNSVGAVAWSPDSRSLAAVGSEDPAGMVLWQGWLYVLQPGSEPRRITGDDQRPTWAAARARRASRRSVGRPAPVQEHRGALCSWASAMVRAMSTRWLPKVARFDVSGEAAGWLEGCHWTATSVRRQWYRPLLRHLRSCTWPTCPAPTPCSTSIPTRPTWSITPGRPWRSSASGGPDSTSRRGSGSRRTSIPREAIPW